MNREQSAVSGQPGRDAPPARPLLSRLRRWWTDHSVRVSRWDGKECGVKTMKFFGLKVSLRW